MSQDPRYAEQEPLTPEQLQELTDVLNERRDRIVRTTEQSIDTIREDGALRMSDEVDLASAEWDQTLEQRMRGRDKALLKKVEKALRLIDEGEYGECESCGNYIGYKRLVARPEATMCIECKEEQERVEKNFQKARRINDNFPFK